MNLETLPIPEKKFGRTLQAWEHREIEQLRSKLVDPARAEVRDGVRYWLSNGAVIPPHVYKDAYAVCPPEQQAAYDKETKAFMEEYRRQRANYQPSEEELFEMRAAFGPDEVVVDVLTGQKFRT